MQAELAPVAALFRSLGARVLHYKTCSTFDSAPHIGSIGAAVRALRGAVEQPWTAIVGGQPNLGRHCLFGNLFAAAGAGGEVFRIDRHPTMSRHPVTPMHEADLRLHLAGQGLHDVHSIPFTAASTSTDVLEEALQRTLHPPAPATPPDVVLFDVADAAQLGTIGQVLWARALRNTLLAVGPSSVVDALAAALGPHNGTQPLRHVVAPAPGPVLVLAGSLSPVTARQVAAAQSFDIVWLDAPRLALRDAPRWSVMPATSPAGSPAAATCWPAPAPRAGSCRLKKASIPKPWRSPAAISWPASWPWCRCNAWALQEETPRVMACRRSTPGGFRT
jgi:uncharacterized protein YgbK (DUF1537 family)